MITKGIPRISQGTAQAQKTKGAAIDRLLSNVDAAAAAANALPKGGLEQSIARASTFMREMSNRSKQG
jgi:ABC-type transporter Mla subunit MlaD